ncbi:MAG: ADP-ribose 1-phosphate phophatase related protein [Verrucomicrobiales bacterium]|nr:ADP-ribose 1-phosphate phophatase related protein [Verrucomicrobiales bacterium]
MIVESSGNLLDSPAEALVNAVNCVGVMGKGIALQFAKAFPSNLLAYQTACRRKEVEPGKMFVTRNPNLTGPEWIINFPTKRHWKGWSRLDDVASGLTALTASIQEHNIRSIAVPPLGCGNGGLNWADVRPLIEEAFAALPSVKVFLFSPMGASKAAAMPNKTKRPKVTDTAVSSSKPKGGWHDSVHR